MALCNSTSSLTQTLAPWRERGGKIGFVPSMGALHDGHGSLVAQALSENDCVVVSIFVNPTQFNNAADLEKYPRPFEQDLAFLKAIDPKIVVFAPEATELYQGEVQSKAYRFGPIASEMEGRHRPGHFDGVGTVLNLLFRAVEPTNAYFGEKDFQQLQIVRKLVELEKLPVNIIGCAIYRADNGLAMSSRNRRLTPEQLEAAPFIFKILKQAQKDFDKKSIPAIVREAEAAFAAHPILELEYFEIAGIHNLKTAYRKHPSNTYRAFVAAFAGEVRLIDNMGLN
ncbi:pantoate--beta-alanine ligase [Gilvibacter sp.]|uniref:pantoate--beta-alanine ligase n=1 Tax=Gilvibacter sp. TaxID=2729997 RepID=UPI0025BE9088|nr:pantoate--beta-alanine ligase [Gilvibacter sp.]NQX76444.1 pantoate--beta-alanine ligase [Gilvibacter sp.]